MARSHAAARLACAVHRARAMTTARPTARATTCDAVRAFASRAPASRARARAVAAASSSANDGSLGRERAADLARANDDDAYDDDPLVHMGRTNKSALKRLGASGAARRARRRDRARGTETGDARLTMAAMTIDIRRQRTKRNPWRKPCWRCRNRKSRRWKS